MLSLPYILQGASVKARPEVAAFSAWQTAVGCLHRSAIYRVCVDVFSVKPRIIAPTNCLYIF